MFTTSPADDIVTYQNIDQYNNFMGILLAIHLVCAPSTFIQIAGQLEPERFTGCPVKYNYILYIYFHLSPPPPPPLSHTHTHFAPGSLLLLVVSY